MARRRLPRGFDRASGGVSEEQDRARRKRVAKKKKRIQREAEAWAAPRSVFLPSALREKPRPKRERLSPGEAFAASVEHEGRYTKTGKRRQATKKQRRELQSAQDAKRRRLARLARERAVRVNVEKQPRNVYGTRKTRLRAALEAAEQAAERSKDIEALVRIRKLKATAGVGDEGAVRKLGRNLAEDAEDVAKGFGPFAARAVTDMAKDIAAFQADRLDSPFRRTRENLVEPTVEHYKETYAEPILEGKPGKILDTAREHPLLTALDFYGAGSGAARLGVVGRNMARGMKPGEAVRRAYHPAQPRELAASRGTGELQTVKLRQSPNPLKRAIDRAYDEFSMKHPEMRSVGAQTRVMREQRRQRDRSIAPGHARVANWNRALKQLKGNERKRWAWLAELPPALRTPEGLRAVRDKLIEEQKLLGTRKPPGRNRAANLAELREKINQLTREIPKHREGTKIRATKERQLKDRKVELARAENELAGTDAKTTQQIKDIDEILATPRSLKDIAKSDAAFVAAAEGTAETNLLMKELTGMTDEQLLDRQARWARELFGEETPPSDIFYPHRWDDQPPRNIDRRPPSDRIGRLRKPTWITRRNNLEAVKSGSTIRDPHVIVDHWLRVQALHTVNRDRKLLWSWGEDRPVNYRLQKGEVQIADPAGGGQTPQWVDAIMSARTPAEFEKLVGEATAKWVSDAEVLQPGWRVLPGHLVDTYYGKHIDPKAGVGDIINVIVKDSLLYLNPGYIPANLVGNLIFLGLQQPFLAIPHLVEAGGIILKDRELATLLYGRVGGRGPTAALALTQGVRRGEGATKRAILQSDKRLSNVIGSIPDDWPRLAAWLYEAKLAGVPMRHSELKKALKSKDPAMVQLLNDVDGRTDTAMVDFQLGPRERQTLSRAFFVWPWIRGATRWTYKFATDKPEKAALVAQAAEREQEKINRQLGELPSWLAGPMTMSVEGDVATVIPTRAASPTMTPADLFRTLSGLATDNPGEYDSIMAMLNPALEEGANIAKHENQYGENVGYRRSIQESLVNLFPPARIAREALQGGPDVYVDQGWQDVLKRRGLRTVPTRIRLSEAHESARKEFGKKAPTGAISVGDDDLTYEEWLAKAKRHRPPAAIRAQAKRRIKVAEELGDLAGRERVLKLVDVAGKIYPAERKWRPYVQRATDSELDSIRDSIYEDLWGDLNEWNDRLESP